MSAITAAVMSAITAAKIVALEPKTAETRSGLCPWEDAGAFTRVRDGYVRAYEPKGPVEASLIDRMVWIEWRRARLRTAEAAVHVAHAFDEAGDSDSKSRTLSRAGVREHGVRDQLDLAEVLRGSDEDDEESLVAIRQGISDVETALGLIDSGQSLAQALESLDEEMRDWWTDALQETDDAGNAKFSADIEGLRNFLADDALPWRRRWLTVNEVRPAIRAQAIAESFDPVRLRQLWDMEARLDRQFEKALSMLVRLREMRLCDRKT